MLVLRNFTHVKNPRSYRPGVLLHHLKNDLKNVDCEINDDEVTLIVHPNHGPTFKVIETLKKDFLQHITIAKFVVPLPWMIDGKDIHIIIAHTGWFKRSGLQVKVKKGDFSASTFEQHLTDAQTLFSNLMVLDFTKFEIKSDGKDIYAEVLLYGGSEVVSRFPAFRRYIRLDNEQQTALVRSFDLLCKLDLKSLI